ncbi:hypothetical protein JCM18918_2982 [Cutibacterium acnes JCM 18918]|nr:hypothetical protein JCM18918_2982 [Cutibacterium acnes JCM 18918]
MGTAVVGAGGTGAIDDEDGSSEGAEFVGGSRVGSGAGGATATSTLMAVDLLAIAP